MTARREELVQPNDITKTTFAPPNANGLGFGTFTAPARLLASGPMLRVATEAKRSVGRKAVRSPQLRRSAIAGKALSHALAQLPA